MAKVQMMFQLPRIRNYKCSQSIKMIVSVVTLFFVAQQIKSQEDYNRAHKISVSTGLESLKVQDLLFSPLIYKNTTLKNLELEYTAVVAKGIHFVNLNLSYSKIDPPQGLQWQLSDQVFERDNSEAARVSLKYGYLHKTYSKNNLTMYIGGNAEAKLQWFNYVFAMSDEDAYLFTNTLQPQFRADYVFNTNNSLSVNVSFPVLAYVSRPEYALVDNHAIQNDLDVENLALHYRNGDFVSLNKLRAVSASLFYITKLSGHIDFQVRYRFEYTRFTDPQTVSIQNHHLGVGLTFNF